MKKVLALVLALVMSLSLLTIANAATFKDADDVKTYNEAVQVLAGLDVIQGKGDGNYDPQSPVTRAEMATILYRATTGDVKGKNVPNNQSYGALFNDVAKGSWYAGYVGYAANAGYVKGKGNNNYDPNGNVTGYEVLVMMLRAIGYTHEDEFTGKNGDWRLESAMMATKLGLLENVTKEDLNDPAARELVAELVFRSMLVPTVSWSRGDGYTGELYKETSQPMTLGYENFWLLNLTRFTGDKALTTANNEKVEDVFGRPGTIWVKDANKDGYRSDAKDLDGTGKDKVVAFVPDEPIVTYENKSVSGGKIYSDNGKKANASMPTYTDGVTGTLDVGNGKTGTVGGYGAVVEVYADRIVVINTYVSTIDKYTAEVKNSDGEIDTEESVTLTTTTVTNGAVSGAGALFETHDFSKADATNHTVVLYTAAKVADSAASNDYYYADRNGTVTVQSVKAASNSILTVKTVKDATDAGRETTTGTIAASYFTAGGTTYHYSNKYNATDALVDFDGDGVTDLEKAAALGKSAIGERYIAYFDNYGNPILTQKYVAGTDAGVYVVLGADDVKNTDQEWYIGLKVMTLSGATMTVKALGANAVNTGAGANVIGKVNSDGTYKDTEAAQAVAKVLEAAAPALVTYTVDANGYAVVDLQNTITGSKGDAPNDQIKYEGGYTTVPKGDANFTKTVNADDTTVFILAINEKNTGKIQDYTFQIVTGIKNVPTLDTLADTNVFHAQAGQSPDVLLLMDPTVKDDPDLAQVKLGEYIYVVDEVDEQSEDYNTYKVIRNGKVEYVNTNVDAFIAGKTVELVKDKLYQITGTSNGGTVITSVSKAIDKTADNDNVIVTTTGASAYKNGVLTTAETPAKVTLDNNVVIVDKSGNAKTTSDLSKSKLTIITNEYGYAAIIIITGANT